MFVFQGHWRRSYHPYFRFERFRLVFPLGCLLLGGGIFLWWVGIFVVRTLKNTFELEVDHSWLHKLLFSASFVLNQYSTVFVLLFLFFGETTHLGWSFWVLLCLWINRLLAQIGSNHLKQNSVWH